MSEFNPTQGVTAALAIIQTITSAMGSGSRNETTKALRIAVKMLDVLTEAVECRESSAYCYLLKAAIAYIEQIDRIKNRRLDVDPSRN